MGACLIDQPDPLQKRHGGVLRLSRLLLKNLNRAFCDVFQCSHMREEVEPLKHHAGCSPLPGDFLFAERMERIADAAIASQFAIEPKRARVDALKLIDAPEEWRLSGP